MGFIVRLVKGDKTGLLPVLLGDRVVMKRIGTWFRRALVWAEVSQCG